MKEKIEEVLASVRPRLERHGGGVEIKSVDQNSGEVHIRLTGGCQGCAMANVTLKAGIEALIMDAVPEVTAVIDATNHKEGEDPYYN